ncbi:MAG: DUF1573 domain-containing protein [FCB group bacterium]|jgi:hypothetical protein|nr:DUF1573 domain-containing protein [FCB group bacterium]
MRLRSNQIVVVVLVAIAGVLGLVFWAALSPASRESTGLADEDFLRSVREEAVRNPETAATEVGGEAPGGADASKVAVIDVLRDFDAGTIPNDRITTKTLPIRNTGTFDLTIGQIGTQCACTVGAVERKVIPPGGEVPMTIALDPRRILGFESKKLLTIFSNDPKSGMTTVSVSCKVEPEFAVEPEKVELGQITKGQTVTAQVVFRQLQDAPFADDVFEVTGVKVGDQSNAMTASVKARPESEWASPKHREYVVELTFDSTLAPVGAYDAVLSVDNTCKRVRTYRLSVHGEVVAAGAAAPTENPA